MTARRTPTAVVLVVVAALAIGPAVGAYAPAAGSQTFASGTGPAVAGAPAANDTSNASLGAAISSFMQASSANAAGEVDSGMFEAKFNDTNASARARLVHARVDTLSARVEQLREERADLLNATDDGNVSVAERARAARLTARIDALTEAINGTERAAERAGVDVTRLDELRTNARNLTGREVAAIATGLAGGGPGNGNGPPGLLDGNGPPGLNVSDPGNGGPPENPGGGPGQVGGDGANGGNESDGDQPGAAESDGESGA